MGETYVISHTERKEWNSGNNFTLQLPERARKANRLIGVKQTLKDVERKALGKKAMLSTDAI